MHVDHLGAPAVPYDRAAVGALTTGLSVERGAAQHDLRDLPLGGLGQLARVADQQVHPRLGAQLVVRNPLGLTEALQRAAIDGGVGVLTLLRRGIGLRPPALLGHQAAEAFLVDRKALLGGHLEREVDREPVGVVQLERLVASEARFARLLRVGRCGVEDLGTLRERLREGVLLGVRDLRDAIEVGLQLGVRALHRVHAYRQQLRHRRPLDTEQAHRTNRAADEPAQHIAATLVARRHAVAHQHQRAAYVVCDDAEPDVVLLMPSVRTPAELGRAFDDREDLVDLVQVVDALQDRSDSLEAHAGVDVLVRQLADDLEPGLLVTAVAVELHEDEVPDLHEPVLVDDGAAVLTVLRPAVVEDLAARATWAGDAH